MGGLPHEVALWMAQTLDGGNTDRAYLYERYGFYGSGLKGTHAPKRRDASRLSILFYILAMKVSPGLLSVHLLGSHLQYAN
jgi:hypothetical protein